MTIYELALRFREQLLARDEATRASIRSDYEVVEKAILAEVEKLLQARDEALANGEAVGTGWLNRKQRLDALLEQARLQLDGFATRSAERITTAQGQAALTGIGDAARLLPQTTFNPLPTGAIEALAGFMGDGRELGSSGTPMVEYLTKKLGAKEGLAALPRLRQALITGIALGKPARQISKSVSEAVGIARMGAERIARTEVTRAYREASRRTYEANSDIVSGWRFLAAHGTRTCPVCLAMHGSIHPVTEPFGSHSNCRCVSVPVLTGEEGEPFETGEEWLRKQSTETQVEILGKEAAALWQSGRVQLADFVEVVNDPNWGMVRQVRSVEDLAKIRREAPRSIDIPGKLSASMDALSQVLFGSRDVTVTYAVRRKSAVQRTEVEIFGRKLKPIDYAELVGAPSGASIHLDTDDDFRLDIAVHHPLYDRAQMRSVYKDEGHVYLSNDYFFKSADAPRGLGTRVFARQALYARKLGVDYFLTQATGRKGDRLYNGYYTWAVLGYSLDISDRKSILAAAGFLDVEDTIALFERPGGREWWDENGRTANGVFDLRPGSRSHTMLMAYLAQNGVVVDENQ